LLCNIVKNQSQNVINRLETLQILKVSNLNLKVDHSFSLKTKCEKKDATIVPLV
jgi:hypothetical protein